MATVGRTEKNDKDASPAFLAMAAEMVAPPVVGVAERGNAVAWILGGGGGLASVWHFQSSSIGHEGRHCE